VRLPAHHRNGGVPIYDTLSTSEKQVGLSSADIGALALSDDAGSAGRMRKQAKTRATGVPVWAQRMCGYRAEATKQVAIELTKGILPPFATRLFGNWHGSCSACETMVVEIVRRFVRPGQARGIKCRTSSRKVGLRLWRRSRLARCPPIGAADGKTIEIIMARGDRLPGILRLGFQALESPERRSPSRRERSAGSS